MKTKWMLLFVVLLCATVFAVDFSGTWVLNNDKSEFGEGRGGRMAAKKLVVEQNDNALKIESTREGRNGEDRTRTEELTLDGKETKDSTNWGESVSTAKIADDVLTINTKRTFERNGQSNEMTTEQTWSLQEDGKQLLVHSKSNSPWGENDVKLVYDKQ